MARYELTLTGGEKILVDHPATAMDELLAAFEGRDFVQFAEVKPGTSSLRDIIVSSEHVALVRPLDSESQGSQFRPKR